MSEANRPARATAGWLLAMMALLIAAMRWHTFAEPRERDLGIYAWVGHYLFRGHALYSDLVDIKPPLPYVLNGLVESITGLGDGQAYLLGVASAWATLLGLYRLGAKALASRWVGLAAAMLWVLLGSDLDLQANQPNTEAFINAFFVWGMALWLERPRDERRAASLSAGALFGLASLCKTVAIVPALAVVGVQPLLEAPGLRRTAMLRALAAGVGMLTTWAITAALLAASGSFGSAWLWLVEYPARYASLAGSSMAGNLLHALQWRHLVPGFFAPHAGLVLACLALLAAAGLRGEVKAAAPLLAWAGGIFVAVALPGNFYPHYYQLWLPWLAIAGAWSIAWLGRTWPTLGRRASLAALGVFAALWIAIRLVPQYRLDADQWSIRKYGSQFVDARRLGRELGAELGRNERLFVFGAFPGLYAAAGRQPPSGVMNVWLALPIYGVNLNAQVGRRVLDGLRGDPPDVVVIDAETWALAGPNEPIRRWIAANYRPAGGAHGFAIARRRDH